MTKYKVLTRSRSSVANDLPPGENFNKALDVELNTGWLVAGKILFSRDHSIISVVLKKNTDDDSGK